MKSIIALSIWFFVGVVYAGGTIGGSSGVGLTVGDIEIELSRIENVEEPTFELHRDKILEVVAGSMSKKPMKIDGEPIAADRFDFQKGQMILRSSKYPSQVYILQEKIESEAREQTLTD